MAGRKFVLGEQSAKWLRQQMRIGPAAPMTRLTFREAPGGTSPGAVIPVALVVLSGQISSSPADWVYRAEDLYTREVLIDSVAPGSDQSYYKRPTAGRLTAATHGLVCLGPITGAPGSEYILMWCNEAIIASRCTG